MWTCDHHSGWRGHFLDGSFGHRLQRAVIWTDGRHSLRRVCSGYAFSINHVLQAALPFRLRASQSVTHAMAALLHTDTPVAPRDRQANGTAGSVILEFESGRMRGRFQQLFSAGCRGGGRREVCN